jgi:hypothetical protein
VASPTLVVNVDTIAGRPGLIERRQPAPHPTVGSRASTCPRWGAQTMATRIAPLLPASSSVSASAAQGTQHVRYQPFDAAVVRRRDTMNVLDSRADKNR